MALRKAPSPAEGSSATFSAKRCSGRYPARSRTSSTIHGLVYTTPGSRGGERVEPKEIMSSFEQFAQGVSKEDFGRRRRENEAARIGIHKDPRSVGLVRFGVPPQLLSPSTP